MFLCRDIVTHIKNAKEAGFEYIYADTNGALADRKNLEAVIMAGLDSIKFSINAGKSDTYKKIHGQDKFETLHITFDGFLTACCQDFNYDLLLADLKKMPLKDAWVSNNAVILRRAHLNRSVEGFLCDNCVKPEYQKYTPLKL